MKYSSMKRRGLALLLALCLTLGMVPQSALPVFAVSVEPKETQTNVEKVQDLAEQLLALNYNRAGYVDLNTKDDVSPENEDNFSWDTEEKADNWRYYNGIMLDAFLMADTASGSYTAEGFAQAFYDANLDSDKNGTFEYLAHFASGELDSVPPARSLFDLLGKTSNDALYIAAIQFIYKVLYGQRTVDNTDGNFKHKDESDKEDWLRYPFALDGMYMAQPFLMEYANALEAKKFTSQIEGVTADSIYDAVCKRFVWVAENMYDNTSKLYHHGWNPAEEEGNGVYWLRAIGWYAAALVDVIELMPPEQTYTDAEGNTVNCRAALIAAAEKLFKGMLNHQDKSGLWYNIVNMDDSVANNKLETSGSALMAYAMMKAYSSGWVGADYGDAGLKAFNGVCDTYLVKDGSGNYELTNIYRSASVGSADEFAKYYLDASKWTGTENEAKGVGPLIMASTVAKAAADTLNEDPDAPIDITTSDALGMELKLDKTTATVVVGNKTTITPVISLINNHGATPSVTWTSSDTNVATVVNGVVTAVSEGTATITATATLTKGETTVEESATATVTVIAGDDLAGWVGSTSAKYQRITSQSLDAAVGSNSLFIIGGDNTYGKYTLTCLSGAVGQSVQIQGTEDPDTDGYYTLANKNGTPVTHWYIEKSGDSGYIIYTMDAGTPRYFTGTATNSKSGTAAITDDKSTAVVWTITEFTDDDNAVSVSGSFEYENETSTLKLKIGSGGPSLGSGSKIHLYASSAEYLKLSQKSGAEKTPLQAGCSIDDIKAWLVENYEILTASSDAEDVVGSVKSWDNFSNVSISADTEEFNSGVHNVSVTVDGMQLGTVAVTIEASDTETATLGKMEYILNTTGIKNGEKYVIAAKLSDTEYIVLGQNDNDNNAYKAIAASSDDNGSTIMVELADLEEIELLFTQIQDGSKTAMGELAQTFTLSHHASHQSFYYKNGGYRQAWKESGGGAAYHVKYRQNLEPGVYYFAYDASGALMNRSTNENGSYVFSDVDALWDSGFTYSLSAIQSVTPTDSAVNNEVDTLFGDDKVLACRADWWKGEFSPGLLLTDEPQTWTYETVMNADVNGNYFVPVLVLFRNGNGVIDNTAAGYVEELVIRTDDWAWVNGVGDKYTAGNPTGYQGATGTIVWDDFITALKAGIICTVTAQLVNGNIVVALELNSSDGVSLVDYTMTYIQPIDGEGDVYLGFTGQGCTISNLQTSNTAVSTFASTVKTLTDIAQGPSTVLDNDQRTYVTEAFTIDKNSDVTFTYSGETRNFMHAELRGLRLYKVGNDSRKYDRYQISVAGPNSSTYYLQSNSHDFDSDGNSTDQYVYVTAIDQEAGQYHFLLWDQTKNTATPYKSLIYNGPYWSRNNGSATMDEEAAKITATNSYSDGLLYLYEADFTDLTDSTVGFSVSPESHEMYEGWSFTPGVTITLDGAALPEGVPYVLEWTSEDTSIATVDQYTGEVTAKKAGVTTITATLKSINGETLYDAQGNAVELEQTIGLTVNEVTYSYNLEPDAQTIARYGEINFDILKLYIQNDITGENMAMDTDQYHFDLSEADLLDKNGAPIWDENGNPLGFDSSVPGTYLIPVYLDDHENGTEEKLSDVYLTVTVAEELFLDDTEVIRDIELLAEYPSPGAVKIHKSATAYTADGQSFKNTGVGEIELSVAGMTTKGSVDVVLIVDVSNSMAWDTNNSSGDNDAAKIPTLNDDGSFDVTQTKLYAAMQSASSFAEILLKDNAGMDNTLSFVTFAGNDFEHNGEKLTIDSVQTVFTGEKDYEAVVRSFNNTQFTRLVKNGTSVSYVLKIAGTDGNDRTNMMMLSGVVTTTETEDEETGDTTTTVTVDHENNSVVYYDIGTAYPNGYYTIEKDGVTYLVDENGVPVDPDGDKEEFVVDEETGYITYDAKADGKDTATYYGWVSSVGSGGLNRGNTNYDYAFSEAIQAVQQIKSDYETANGISYEDSGRELHVIFMTDGAPSHYNSWKLNSGKADHVSEWALDENGAPYEAEASEDYDEQTEYEDTASTRNEWLQRIRRPHNNATVLKSLIDGAYSVGFDIDAGGFGNYKFEPNDLKIVLQGLSKNASVPVKLADKPEELELFYMDLANTLTYAGKNAVVTDYIDKAYRLYTGLKPNAENATAAELAKILPKIEVRAYDLYTIDDIGTGGYNLNGAMTVSADDVGERKHTAEAVTVGSYSYHPYEFASYEKIEFTVNDDGSLTATRTYIDRESGEKITGEKLAEGTQITFGTVDGYTVVTEIVGEYFTYTYDPNADPGEQEKFVWTIGDIADLEYSLVYDAYLTGSFDYVTDVDDDGQKEAEENSSEDIRQPASYETNTEAMLSFITSDGKAAEILFPEPALPWQSVALTVQFHLVNAEGKPINRLGMPTNSNAILATVGEQYTMSFAWQNNETLKTYTADELLEELQKNTGMYGDLVTYDGNTAITIYNVEEARHMLTGDGMIFQGATNDGSQFGVSIAIVIEPVEPEAIVIDYGKPVTIDVMKNDRDDAADGVTISLVGFVAYDDDSINVHAPLDENAIARAKSTQTVNTQGGTFSIVNDEVVFTPTDFLSEVQHVYAVLEVVNVSQDTQIHYCNRVDVIPANIMYYETNFASGVFTQDTTTQWQTEYEKGNDKDDNRQDTTYVEDPDTYGYDSTYTEDDLLSDGSSVYVEGMGPQNTFVDFSFTGTGFDIISRTDPDQGTIRVEYTNRATGAAKVISVINKGENELYQIPVISVHDLEFGTYDVRIRVYDKVTYPNGFESLNRRNEFYFDAIRIYNSVLGNAQAEEAYKSHGEYDPFIKEVRDILIEADIFKNHVDSGVSGGLSGAIFMDDYDGNTTFDVAAYEARGANNETYLSENQGVAFAITLDDSKLPAGIDIGAKSVDGETVTMKASVYNGTTLKHSRDITINSSTAQYYDLLDGFTSENFLQSGGTYYVVIQRTGGDGILSLTDIKVGYSEDMEGVFTAQLYYATEDWGIEEKAYCAVNGTGTYTIDWNPGKTVTDVGVFVIDILGAYNATAAEGNIIKVTDISVSIDGQKVAVDRSNIISGDIEGNGNHRIEIYSPYGKTSSDLVISKDEFKDFTSLSVTFTIEIVDRNGDWSWVPVTGVSATTVTAQSKLMAQTLIYSDANVLTLAAALMADANYDIQSVEFTEDEVGVVRNAIMEVVTTQDVVRLQVVDSTGERVQANALYVDNALGQRVWKVVVRPALLGEQTYTVTGFGADGTSGASGSDSITVTLSES